MKNVLFACLFAAVVIQTARPAESPVLQNGIAVIVNDRVITLKDLYEATRSDEEFLRRRFARDPKALEEKLATLHAERLEQMVEHYLVLNEFNTLGYPLPESYINNRMNEDIKQRYGDRLTLTKTLQAEGITFETYKTRVRENAILELMWASRVPRDPLISPTKIEKYYLENRDKFKVEDKVSLKMITLDKKPNDAENSAMKLAGEIVKKIKEGASFGDMAQVYSQDSFGRNGGDRGWVEFGPMLKELKDAILKLPPGEVSEPIETEKAIFLIVVNKFEPEHIAGLSEVREDIEKTLKGQEIQRLRKQFVERLKKKSFVRYY